jgi:flagellar protein FlaG
MNPQQPQPAKIHLSNTADYREHYANSVQVRVSLWDFFLMFGTINQNTPEEVSIKNFQGVFLSPQQAKALANVLNQNVSQYESAFGPIRLDAKQAGGQVQ